MDDHGKRGELERLQKDLSDKGLSRRDFVTRLKGIGLGFGAAFVLGVGEANAFAPDAQGVSLKSSHPAVDQIIAEGQASRDADNMEAQYGRFYRRGYVRYGRYGRYGRYARYARYTRYARVYGRVMRPYY